MLTRNRIRGHDLIVHRRTIGLFVGLLVVAGTVSFGGTNRAHAEPSAEDKALATMFFQEGRMLMAEGRVADACPKLEESQRLDPGGGTLLNLALCHELEGRLARSWSEFKEAAIMARRDGRRDRESEATSHVNSLEPRLSWLTIVVPARTQVEGLVIERDGHEVGQGAWSTAIPIDGGPHVVRASALGRDPFTATIVIGNEADNQTVEIPVLATPVVVVALPRVSSPVQPSAGAAPALPTFTPARLRWAGIGTAGVGVLLLGTAGYALATALSAKHASNSNCFADGCNDAGLQSRHDAISRGNLATLLGVSGAVLVGAGATLFYLAHRSRTTARTTASARQREAQFSMRFMLGAAPGTVVAGIGGDL
jgi:protein-S-isoprenylcysteine O-methyltransferase Ste14